uniref:Uncharacterized protein n=1 Tax=Fervidicoccus fontis TaxID=683846 RepID=A0A7J3ZLZ6_9CREN
MPEEILFSSISELVERSKEIVKRSIECRIKYNKDNVKIKFRTKRKLYTAVLTAEKAGVSDVKELKEKAKKIAEELGCKEMREIG